MRLKDFLLLLMVVLPIVTAAQVTNPNYDEQFAQRLGADEYGMKYYVLVILKTGSNQTRDERFIDSCFSGHLQNIERLARQGKLVVAGPLKKNPKSYRGIFILNVDSFENAQALLQTDPTVRAQLLEAELYN